MLKPTVTQASESGLIAVTNKNTKKIERIASLADLQIGLPDLSAKLQLFGDLILKASSVTLDGGVTYTTPKNTNCINIFYSGIGSGAITIKLPEKKTTGQIAIIKDASGDASTINLTLSTSDNTTIDGASTQTISTDYEAKILLWNGTEWITIASNSGGGSGAPTNAQYVTLATNGTLTDERVLTAGTGISIVDGGAGSTVTISTTGAGSGDVVGPASATDNAVVRFDLTTGKLIQNSGVLIDDSNNTTIPGDLAVNGPTSADITTTTTTATVFNSTATTLNIGGAATAITLGDSTTATTTVRGGTLVGNATTQNIFNTTATTVNAFGAATAITLGATPTATTTIRGGTLVGDQTTQNLFNTVATTLNIGGGSTAAVNIGNSSATNTVSGKTKFPQGLSGSLTKLDDGTSYLIAGERVTITSASNGAVTINSTGADAAASYVVISATGSLANERVLTAGSGISILDNGAGNSVTISATGGVPGGSDSEVQFNDSGTFNGDLGLRYNRITDTLIGVNLILSGDLTVNGTTTTINTNNLEVKDSLIGLGFASGSVAQTDGDRGIIMSRQGGSGNRTFYWSNSLNEFAVVASTTPPASSSISVNFYTDFHAANIQGDIVSSSLGFSGSHTRLIDGTSAFIAGSNITITSASNGAVTIAATSGGGTPAGNDTEIQFNDAGSFGSSANLTYNSTSNQLTVTGSFVASGSVNLYTSGAPGVGIKAHSGYTGSDSRTITGAVTTTDATTTTIATITGSAGGPGTTYWVEAFFTAHNGTNNFGAAQRVACFYINASGNSMNQQGSTQTPINIGQFPTWGANLTTQGASIIATVTGQGSTTIDWACTVRYQAVSSSL